VLIDDVQGVHHRADSAEHGPLYRQLQRIAMTLTRCTPQAHVSLWLWLMHDSGAQPADDYQVCSW
jgi:hypothetical protein